VTVRIEGPLNYTQTPRFFADKFLMNRSFGPELFFGTAMAEALPAGRFTLIKHAYGGSKLVNASWSNEITSPLHLWAPGNWRARRAEKNDAQSDLPPAARGGSDNEEVSGGSDHEEGLSRPGELYENLIADVSARLRNDASAVLSGVLWVHGELEGRNALTAGTYARALSELVAAMRSDLGIPDLPFAMLMPWPAASNLTPVLPEFLSTLDALERDLPLFNLVRAPNASLEVYGDRYPSLSASPFQAADVLGHYTEAGQRIAGGLLARHALASLVSGAPA